MRSHDSTPKLFTCTALTQLHLLLYFIEVLHHKLLMCSGSCISTREQHAEKSNSKCGRVKDVITLNSGLFSAAQQPPTWKPNSKPTQQHVPIPKRPGPRRPRLDSGFSGQKSWHRKQLTKQPASVTTPEVTQRSISSTYSHNSNRLSPDETGDVHCPSITSLRLLLALQHVLNCRYVERLRLFLTTPQSIKPDRLGGLVYYRHTVRESVRELFCLRFYL